MNPRSQKAAEFSSEFLYGQSYDFAVKQAVRHQQSLDEVLEHASIEKVWKVIMDPGDGKAAVLEPLDGELAKSEVLVHMLPPERLSTLQQPENSSKLELLEQAAEAARKQVRSQLQTADSSLSLQKLSKLLKNMEVSGKLHGTTESSILIIYGIDAAGEHERDARRSGTPARKEHMEKVLQAVLASRGESLPDFSVDPVVLPQMDPSDVQLGSHHWFVAMT